MNYKRTVEDFKKCGSKASTVYGLPFVSDCVGNSDLNLKCDDLAYPVPCSDGVCHSDYISCLRVSELCYMFGNPLTVVLFISLWQISQNNWLIGNYSNVGKVTVMKHILNMCRKTLPLP
jgi:hypothetical protein